MDSVSDQAPVPEQETHDTSEPDINTRETGFESVEPDDPALDARRATLVTPWVPGEQSATPEAESAPAGEFDLPEAQPAADLARSTLKARWVLLVFGITLIFYWLFVNQIVLYSSPPTGDQAFYLMVTMSIVQDGDFNLANNYANLDENKFYRLAPHPPDFVGMDAPYPLPPHDGFTPARPATEMYNFHWPGLSLLVAPAWVIGGLSNLWWPATVVFMCIIGALLATNIFLFAHEMTGRVWIAVVVWAALAFSNPLMSYTYLIFSELTCGLLMLYAFRRLALGWGSNGWFRLILIGFCIAYIPWVAWRCAPIAFGLGVYAIVQWWRWMRVQTNGSESTAPHSRHPILETAWVIVPVVISIGLLTWYNYFLFGKFFPNNQTPERGDLPIFFWPWQSRENLTHFVTSGYGLLFDRVFGLLPFAPVYLLAAVGIIAMFQSRRRSDRRLLFWMAVVVLPYLGIIMSFFYWDGIWNPPARFQTTLVPLLAAPLALSLMACRSWIYRAIFAVLTAWGFLMMSIFILDPRRLWPANAPYQWMAGGPDYLTTRPFPVQINLWNLFPALDPVDERSLPSNTAWVTLASVAVVVLAYFLMTRWRRAQGAHNSRKFPLVARGATWAVALAVVGASWYFTNYDYIQHRTILTEVQRINASEVIQAPRGIAYLNGKVYVTDYNGHSVGVFDLASGTYSRLQATLNGAPIQYGQPGDIKPAPDGNLYLLNNGIGGDALLEMKPDGTVVNRISMNGKTPVAVGLSVGSDGKIYAADTVGGKIWEYNSTGGDPIVQFGGKTGGFNNIWGTLVLPNGNVLGAESSNKQVQEMKPDGTYLRSYQLGCQPYYMVAEGNWVDVSCPGEGIVTLNTQTGGTQLIWTEPEDAQPLDSPTGMTYGPDGKLYVMDNSTLVVYDVQH